jgi:hypothetical protein
MKRTILPVITLLATVSLLASAALGAPSVKVVPGAAGTRLVLAGHVITIFRTANGGLTADQRAERAATRLRTLLGAGLTADEIDIRNRGAAWGVYARGGLLMIATEEEASERGEEPKATAARWAANLKAIMRQQGAGGSQEATAAPEHPKAVKTATGVKPATGKKPAAKNPRLMAHAAKPKAEDLDPQPPVVKEPTLSLPVDSLVVPVGETRSVPVRGTADGFITVRTEGDETATASALDGKAVIQVKGLAPGKAIVRVGREGKEAAFTVWVKKYAGRIVRTPEAEVTGAMTPGSLVRRSAEMKALQAVQWEPGATVKVTGPPQGLKALARGETATLSFPVTVSGEGLLPVTAVARVRVKNIALPHKDTRLLLYSNDPESVREHGILFEGLVDDAGPTRLLYHHQNRMGQPFTFQIYLMNPNDDPADVQVIEGDAGPYIDPIQAGHRAGQRYLAASTEDEGYVTRIPAHGARSVYVSQVPNLDTVSGIYGFRVLRGGPLVAQVAALPNETRPEVRDDLMVTARSEPHTYTTPQMDETYSYRVGDKWTFMPMGRKAITGKTANRKLFGNYGVLYNINVDLDNPTAEMRTVQVVLAPEAGWARGIFRIQGKIIEAPQVAPPGEAVLWTVKLAPGERQRVNIQGIPVGGSAYPVSIVVRS